MSGLNFAYTNQELLIAEERQKLIIPHFTTKQRLSLRLKPFNEKLLIYDTDVNDFYHVYWTPNGTVSVKSNITQTERIVAAETNVSINHNLGKYPYITILDVGGYEVIADIQHLNVNQIVVIFNKSFTGRIIYA